MGAESTAEKSLQQIEEIFAARDTANSADSADSVLTALMPALCQALDCDRCVLFPRNPATGCWAMTHGWQRRPEFALDQPMNDWGLPADDEAELDPMYAQALVSAEALFIEDVRAESPDVVNAAFEEERYGNRSLAHAPIYLLERGQSAESYYGLIEPCTVGRPHAWTETRRRLVRRVQELIAPVVAAYVAEHGR
jgi:GAF domain-containing protein